MNVYIAWDDNDYYGPHVLQTPEGHTRIFAELHTAIEAVNQYRVVNLNEPWLMGPRGTHDASVASSDGWYIEAVRLEHRLSVDPSASPPGAATKLANDDG